MLDVLEPWLRSADLVEQVRHIAQLAATRAGDLDQDGSFPTEDIHALAAIGALKAPMPPAYGGLGLGTTPQGAPALLDVLRWIGHGSLPLGRLYEGHVNALALLVRFGTASQVEEAARDADDGVLFGVWNTQGSDALALEETKSGWRLRGRKTFASGAGFVGRPLVTAGVNDGGVLMVLPRLDQKGCDISRADLSDWRAHGMRASATGSYDFSGLAVSANDIIGSEGDYHREPSFSAGAWRFAAVQLGGIERLLDEARLHLRRAGRSSDPHQLARTGEAAVATETAKLWVTRAAELAEQDDGRRDPGQVMGYVKSCSLGGRAGRSRRARTRPSLGRPCRFSADPSDRAPEPGPCHLSAAARAGPCADHRRCLRARTRHAGGGSVVMSVRAADALAAMGDMPLLSFGQLAIRGLVVVAPHPDDESLGCGGLIAAATNDGIPVRVVVVSDGAGSHPNSVSYPPARLRRLRESETHTAAAELGVAADAVAFLGLPDRHVPSEGPDAAAAVTSIVEMAQACGADLMTVTWQHDPHHDHQAAFALARAACDQLPAIRLCAYPIWGWTLPPDHVLPEGLPQGFRLAVEAQLPAKRRAIAAHRSQISRMIDDDPDSFMLSAADLARFDQPYETYIRVVG